MKNRVKNLLLSATALVLCCAVIAAANYALTLKSDSPAQTEANDAARVSAAEESDAETGTGKEEVVYVGMDASGNVTDITVVNIWGSGSVTDYGNYTSVKMMTTNDEITLDGDEVTFTTDSDRVYYQGTLSSDTALPWIISVTYYMDGVQYDADEIAGLSGELKIEISVTENTAYDGEGDFYNTYLLQAALTLDTENTQNITAEGATAANVGSDKQLSYMVLPGQGLEAEITADVTDFEMPSIEINGVPLSLALDIDSEELEDTIDELMEALEELESGASEVNDGALELSDGASELDSGTETLESGAASLDEGIDTLYAGMETLYAGLEQLESSSDELGEGSDQILSALMTIESALSQIDSSTEELAALSEASEQIKDGIDELNDGILSLQTNLSYSAFKSVMAANGLDLDELVSGNNQAIEEIESLLKVLKTMESLLPAEKLSPYLEMLGLDTDIFDDLESTAEDLITLLNGNNAAIAGMEAYLDSVSSGTSQLAEGAAALAESYAEFNSAISVLTETLSSMLSQMAVLKSGVEELVDSYEEFDSGLDSYTQGVAQVVSGYNELISGMASLSSGSQALVSGVSELSDGTSQLYEGSLELSEGTQAMADGTSELYSEISDAEDELSEELESLLDAITGESEICSFVSSKNTNVEAVQFVITTEAIEAEETEEEVQEEDEEESGFWAKIKGLFGN